MKRIGSLLVLACLAACGGSDVEGAPNARAAIESFRDYFADQDFEALYGVISPRIRKDMHDKIRNLPERQKQQVRNEGVDLDDPREIFVMGMEAAMKMLKARGMDPAAALKIEVLDVKETGETAVARIRNSDGEKSLRLVKVNGKWYVDSDKVIN